MAEIVGAFGLSHGPLLSTPPELWHLRAQADRAGSAHAYRGKRYSFDALVEARGGATAFAPYLSLEERTRRHAACQAALDDLAARFRACRADVAIVLGNDQRELFHDEFTPALMVYAGEIIENVFPDREEAARLERLGLFVATPGHCPLGGASYPGAPELALDLVHGLIAQDFDVAISTRLPLVKGKPHGIPHAFGFVFRRLMADAPPPTIPIFLNVGVAPNQPRLARFLAFGHALKAAIDALPAELRVVLVASGGFTHFVIDEAFDQALMTAMRDADEAALAAVNESWFEGNTCEVRSWYPLVTALADAGRRPTFLDYVPCYRSEAGTGQGMVFASFD